MLKRRAPLRGSTAAASCLSCLITQARRLLSCERMIPTTLMQQTPRASRPLAFRPTPITGHRPCRLQDAASAGGTRLAIRASPGPPEPAPPEVPASPPDQMATAPAPSIPHQPLAPADASVAACTTPFVRPYAARARPLGPGRGRAHLDLHAGATAPATYGAWRPERRRDALGYRCPDRARWSASGAVHQDDRACARHAPRLKVLPV